MPTTSDLTPDEIEQAFYDIGDPPFSTANDTLDSREIIEWLELVESTFTDNGYDITIKRGQDFPDGLDDDTDPAHVITVWEDYIKLKRFADEAAQYAGDWEYGATLINESYFTEYAKELTADIGGEVPEWVVVDWEATAKGLLMDYTTLNWEGTDFYVR